MLPVEVVRHFEFGVKLVIRAGLRRFVIGSMGHDDALGITLLYLLRYFIVDEVIETIVVHYHQTASAQGIKLGFSDEDLLDFFAMDEVIRHRLIITDLGALVVLLNQLRNLRLQSLGLTLFVSLLRERLVKRSLFRPLLGRL